MSKSALVITLVFASGVATASPTLAADQPPAWAFPVSDRNAKPVPDDGVPRHVPDSDATFTVTQSRDRFFSPDWHPGDHPPMPPIVAQGKKPNAMACGFCHRADGSGGPENARIAGLPAVYMAQQMADFASGARTTSVTERFAPKLMFATAKAVNEQDVAEAVAYFAAVKPRPAAQVVESDIAPKTRVVTEHLALALEPGTEPIGSRIIEVPEDLEQFELRDGRSRFVAYVPPGSVQKGQTLVTAGNGATVACGICHGADLRGLGPIPGIAGRSPSYIVRQLYDFQSGARAGAWSGLMKPIAEKLSSDDIVALAAYAASLNP